MAIELDRVLWTREVRETLVRALLTRNAINCAKANGAVNLADLYKKLLEESVDRYNHLTGQVEKMGNEKTIMEELQGNNVLPGIIQIAQDKNKGDISLQGIGVAIFGDAVLIDSPGNGCKTERIEASVKSTKQHVMCASCKYFEPVDSTSEWGVCENHSLFRREQIVWANMLGCESDFGNQYSPQGHEESSEMFYKLGRLWLFGILIVVPLDFGLVLPAMPELTILWICLGLVWASVYLIMEINQGTSQILNRLKAKKIISAVVETVKNESKFTNEV